MELRTDHNKVREHLDGMNPNDRRKNNSSLNSISRAIQNSPKGEYPTNKSAISKQGSIQ